MNLPPEQIKFAIIKIMEENTKINIWLKLALGVGRYILGALMLASGPLILLFMGKDPTAVIHAMAHPLFTFFTSPQIIIGFYFMLSGKWRPRVDFTFFMIAAVLIYVFYTFALTFNA